MAYAVYTTDSFEEEIDKLLNQIETEFKRYSCNLKKILMSETK